MVKYLAFLGGLLLVSVAAAGDRTEPFDFEYTVEGGKRNVVVVFNDGESTFVQAREKQKLFFEKGNVATRGPYYVIAGLPTVIEGYSGGEPFKLKWRGGTTAAITNEVGRVNGDFDENSYVGSFGRIAFLNGKPKESLLASPLPASLELKDALKALAPAGWSGKADGSVNTTEEVSIRSTKGDSWIVVLDRIVQELNLWVEIDVAKSNIFLRVAPPKGFSLLLDTSVKSSGDESKQTSVNPERILVPTERVVAEDRFEKSPLLVSANIKSIQLFGERIGITKIDNGLAMTLSVAGRGDLVNNCSKGVKICLIKNDGTVSVTSGDVVVDVKTVTSRVPVFQKASGSGLKTVLETGNETLFEFEAVPSSVDFLANGIKANGTWLDKRFITNTQSKEWLVKNGSVEQVVKFDDKPVFLWKKGSASNLASASKKNIASID